MLQETARFQFQPAGETEVAHAASTTFSAPFRAEQREIPKDPKDSFFLGWKMISRMQGEQRRIIKRRQYIVLRTQKSSMQLLETARIIDWFRSEGTLKIIESHKCLWLGVVTSSLHEDWDQKSLSELRKYTNSYTYPPANCKCQKKKNSTTTIPICTKLIYVNITKAGLGLQAEEFRLTSLHCAWIKQRSRESKTGVANCL